MAQEEINELLLKKANEGKLVVRLKGGDPYVFGRGGEEMLYLKSNGIETEEIPGVTSAIAVPAMAGIPVTHRDVSRSFSVVTGHTKDMDSLYEEIRNSASMNGTCVYPVSYTHLNRLMEFCVESCEKIYVGKRNGRHSMAQEEINELLLKKANEGKLVVRLKGGDPYVFGRGGEEMLYLKSNGIETEEIPGVTSAIAVPAMAGIPVTHRDVSRSFSVVTGHTKDMDSLYEEIRNSASMNGTCVYLMGLTHLSLIHISSYVY